MSERPVMVTKFMGEPLTERETALVNHVYMMGVRHEPLDINPVHFTPSLEQRVVNLERQVRQLIDPIGRGA